MKKYLVKLEKQHFVLVSNVGFYKRIALVNYEQSVQVQHGEPVAHNPNGTDRNDSGGSIWDEAMNFYNPGNDQKGAVN